MSEFFSRVEERINSIGACLCVGLDPRREEMNAEEIELLTKENVVEALFLHGKRIFDNTSHVASSWKINVAFYEVWGSSGWEALERLIPIFDKVAPVLLDCKRGDIGSTATSYAKSAYDLGARAVTVSPYMGKDSIKPFLDQGLDVFMLIRTTNQSAEDIQDQPLSYPMWKRVLEDAMTWSSPNQLGFVVAATDPVTLRKVRNVAPNRWILSPGVGAQGAEIKSTITEGVNACGGKLIIPVSRAISSSPDPRGAAETFSSDIQRYILGLNLAKKRIVTLPFKERVVDELFDSGCVKFGEFKLKSGFLSPIYIDLRRLISYPALLAQIAELYKDKLKHKKFDVLAALPYAALPIGTAVSLTMNKPMIYPRKEQKEYGTGAKIEGCYSHGTRAIVIDDVITRGDSKIEAIQSLESEGILIDEVCVLIDREGGGQELLQSQDKRLISIFKFSDLLEAWYLSGRITQEQLEIVNNFLAKK
jgi:uridine monophosphate synthetase